MDAAECLYGSFGVLRNKFLMYKSGLMNRFDRKKNGMANQVYLCISKRKEEEIPNMGEYRAR